MMTRMGKRRSSNKHLPKRVYLKSGTYYYVTRQNKWIRLGKNEAEMLRALADLQDSKPLTFSDVIDEYLSQVMPRKAYKTRLDQERQAEKLRDIYGHMAPKDITRPAVYRVHQKMGAKSPVSANRHLALLSHIMKYAAQVGHIEDNPCRGVERHKERARDRYVSDAEYLTVQDHATPMLRVLMDLAYLTGQRQGDLVKLTRHQFSDEGIEFKQSKTGRKIIVRWSDSLRAVIAASKRLSGVESLYVLHTDKGQPYTSSGVQTAWQRLMVGCLKEGLIDERFTFQDIRAKAATDAKDGRLLGHLDERTLKRVYLRKPEQFDPVR